MNIDSTSNRIDVWQTVNAFASIAVTRPPKQYEQIYIDARAVSRVLRKNIVCISRGTCRATCAFRVYFRFRFRTGWCNTNRRAHHWRRHRIGINWRPRRWLVGSSFIQRSSIARRTLHCCDAINGDSKGMFQHKHIYYSNLFANVFGLLCI